MIRLLGLRRRQGAGIRELKEVRALAYGPRTAHHPGRGQPGGKSVGLWEVATGRRSAVESRHRAATSTRSPFTRRESGGVEYRTVATYALWSEPGRRRPLGEAGLGPEARPGLAFPQRQGLVAARDQDLSGEGMCLRGVWEAVYRPVCGLAAGRAPGDVSSLHIGGSSRVLNLAATRHDGAGLGPAATGPARMRQTRSGPGGAGRRGPTSWRARRGVPTPRLPAWARSRRGSGPWRTVLPPARAPPLPTPTGPRASQGAPEKGRIAFDLFRRMVMRVRRTSVSKGQRSAKYWHRRAIADAYGNGGSCS